MDLLDAHRVLHDTMTGSVPSRPGGAAAPDRAGADAPGGPRVNRRASGLAYVAAAAILVIFATMTWRGEAIGRPLSWDEWITIENYSWAGLTGDGELRRIRRTHDFEALDAPGPRHLAMGMWAAFGRWPEPNNHIVHSALVNIALLAGRSSRVARVPALLGAVAYGALVFVLCWTTLGWRTAAFPALALSLATPYVLDYAVTARGYTWSLALPTAWILLAIHASRRPGSLLLGVAMAAGAFGCILNLINSAAMFVIPAYVALFAATLGASDAEHRTWRTNLATQAAGIGTTTGLFFLDRLPAIYSSMQQYGISAGSAAQRMSAFRDMLRYLFPPLLWSVVGLIGLAGVTLAWRSLGVRWLALVGSAVGLVSVLYYMVANRLPYDRAMSQLLPLALLGAAWVLWSVLARITAARARVTSGLIAFALLLSASVRPNRAVSAAAAQDQFVASATARVAGAVDPIYPLLFAGIDVPAAAHQFPVEWLDIDAPLPAPSPVTIAAFVKQGNGDTGRFRPIDWVGATQSSVTSEFTMSAIRGRTYDGLSAAPATARTIVFFYPEFDRLAVDSANATDPFQKTGLPLVVVQTRRQIKMQVYASVSVVAVVTGTREESALARRAAAEALQRAGGHTVIFVPESQPR